jgi:AraC-like DNA-binding protein
MWQKAPGVGEAFGLGVGDAPPAPLGQFDTDLVPERDREAYYRTMLRSLVSPATPVLDPGAGPLRVRTRNGQLGEALYVHYRATPHRIERGRRDTEGAPSGCYFLLRQTGEARSFLEVGDEEHRLAAGDCLMGDADAPFLAQAAGPLGFSLYLLPKWMVDATLTARGRDRLAAGFTTSAAAPLGQLLAGWLAGLPDGLSRPTAAGLGGVLGRLAAVAAEDGAVQEPDREALRAARARLVLREIERHFREPLFGPADAAAALGVSVRSIHLAMEATDLSFSEHLTRQRLAEARSLIATGRSPTVLDAALAAGFNDLSTFYRSFRRVFDAAPRDLLAPAGPPQNTPR